MRTALEILRAHPDKGWWGASEESIVVAMEEYAKEKALAAWEKMEETLNNYIGTYPYIPDDVNDGFEKWWEENK
jgi:hypothetical protein